MSRSRAELSIIVPAFREGRGLVPAIGQIRANALLATDSIEVIVVDDGSDDDTWTHVQALATAHSDVRGIRFSRNYGKDSAVAAGLDACLGDAAVIIDADLQHPPEVVPRLLRAAEAEDRDLVVATRFRDGGSHLGLGKLRTLVSRGSAFAARLLFPRRLRGVSDPMSGFFLVRRAAVDLAELKPNGFKILLELLVRTPFESVGEVPYAFAERRAGESKASLREGTRFLLQLIRLRLADASGRLVRFGLIGLSGLVVNESLLAFFTERAGLYYLASAVISTQASILWNFALTERWVYSSRSCRLRWRARLGAFCLVCTTAQVLTIPLLYLLVDLGGLPYLTGNLFAIAASTLLRFTVAERVIWKARPAAVLAPARRSGTS